MPPVEGGESEEPRADGHFWTDLKKKIFWLHLLGEHEKKILFLAEFHFFLP